MTSPMPETMRPRDEVEYWVSLAMDAGLNKQDFSLTEATDATLATLASSGDHEELARLAEAVGLKHLTDDQLFAAINESVTITKDRSGVERNAVCISPEKFRTFLSKEAERGEKLAQCLICGLRFLTNSASLHPRRCPSCASKKKDQWK